MMATPSLRLTEAQHQALVNHLFPADGMEAVALLVCGRRAGQDTHAFTTKKVIPIPHEVCDRYVDRVTWPTDLVATALIEPDGTKPAIVKVHSHPNGYRNFSGLDDESDRRLFESISNFHDDGLPHASAIMFPNGELLGRVLQEGLVTQFVSSVLIIGDDLVVWNPLSTSGSVPSHALRQAQMFGDGTTNLLRKLSVAVVGCSGTGSVVVEQLARLGIGKLVLIDPETVEDKNLNRIINSGKEDAYLKRFKVNVLSSAIARMGFGQEVIPLPQNLASRSAISAVAQCDVVFGCMDGVEGRHLLNRLATFYTMPYFDVGVRLEADGKGGITTVAAPCTTCSLVVQACSAEAYIQWAR